MKPGDIVYGTGGGGDEARRGGPGRSSGPTSSGMARYELISKIRETLCEVYGSSADIAGAV